MLTADLVLLVIDPTESPGLQLALREEVPQNIPCIEVHNKIDLTDTQSKSDEASNKAWVSAKTGQGLGSLIHLIKHTVGATENYEGVFSARTRHLDALKRTQNHVKTGRQQLEQFNAPETLAEELRLAQKSLGEITGEYLPDDLLGAIFSSFCIGK
jgi:tRNA modification GTPase